MRILSYPTGKEHFLLPETYIRAELPEHWRVEGYDKSWEWYAFNTRDRIKVGASQWVGNCFERNATRWEDDRNIEQTNKREGISRAEFEYHIYNPWKEGQVKFERKSEPMQENEMSFPRASQAGWIEDPADGKLKDPTKQPHYNQQPIEVIDMMLAVYGKEAVKHFCLLNSFKYRMRAGHKDDALQDIEKAKWYEAKAKEIDGTPAT